MVELTHPTGWMADEVDLRAVPVPPETESWYPVPYGRLVEELKLHMPRFGLAVANERYCLARDGQQMFGVLTCQGGDDFSIALGLRNSYDRTLSVGIVVGIQVFVCENLAFSGEIEMHRKHTINVFRDLPDLIYRMLNQVSGMNRRQELEFGAMHGRPIRDEFAHHLMVESVKRDVLPASKLPYVIDAWEHPKHEDFKPRTAWSLFNSFTEVAKSRSPRNQMDSTLGLTALFRELVLT